MTIGEIRLEAETFTIQIASPENCKVEEVASFVNSVFGTVYWIQYRTSPDRLSEILQDPKKQVYLCKTSSEKLCGTIQLDGIENDVAHFSMFAIDRIYRGKNLGSSFLQFVEDFLFKQVDVIELNIVTLGQEKLITYYETRGYEKHSPETEMELSEEIRAFYLKPDYRNHKLYVLKMKKGKAESKFLLSASTSF